MKKQKSLPSTSRLGNLILVDKKRLATELSQFQAGVKTKKQWEKEIERYHPIIKCFPKFRWPEVVKYFGWLPLPIFMEVE